MTGKNPLPLCVCACALFYAAPLAAEPQAYISVSAQERPLLKTQEASAITRLTQQDMLEKNAETAGALLEAAPSVALKKGGAPGLAQTAGIRGFSSKNTAVLFNGKRLAADLTGTVDLSIINPAALGALTVSAGPGSPLSGTSAQGGVIDLRTADPGGPDDTGADFSLGDFKSGAYGAWARGGKGPVRLAVSGGRRYSAGFQQNGDYCGEDFTASLRAAPDGAGVFKAEAMSSSLSGGMPGGTPVPISQWDGRKERQANSPTDRQTARRGLFSAAYFSPHDAAVQFSAEAWTSENRLAAFQYGSATRIDTALRAARAGVGLGRHLAFTAQYSRDTLDSNTYGAHAVDTRSAAGQARLDLSDTLELAAGAALDTSSRWAQECNPRAALVWRPQAGWKLSASAARASQPPTFADMYNPWAPPNPDLKPEHSWQYELGARLEQLGGFTAQINGFYAAIDDKIALDPSNGFAAYNLDKGRNMGFEPTLQWRTASSRHRLAYAFVYSEGRQPGQAWQASAYNPVQRVSYGGDFELTQKLALDLFARYVGEQYTGQGRTGVALPAFTTADVSVRYKDGRYGFVFSVDNLTDAHYAENADAFNGYYPMPGRTFRLKLSAAFNG